MVGIDSPATSWVVVALQSFGMLTALTARLNWFQRAQQLCHGLFFLSLILVGLTTAVSLDLGLGHWIFSGSTLAVMAVAATIDCD